MFYKNFKINIENCKGVSPVGKDTLMISKNVIKHKSKKIIEIGTGTGFITIFLNKNGIDCDGVDINPLAISCANANAKNNNIKINFSVSNLFENVNKNYDSIIFNPPYGNSNSMFLSKYLEIIKSYIPKENSILSKISFKLIKKSRANLINKFLKESKNYISKKGSIFLLLEKSELILIKEKYVIIDSNNNQHLIKL